MNLEKIVIAPDSFKESMSAKEASEAIMRGFAKVYPVAHTDYTLIPMADGGEGTTEALSEALQAERVTAEVHDPLIREIMSSYAYATDSQTAIIEMASASGLDLLTPEERHPARTSSYGTGELIQDALDRGATRIILGIGGSATNDGGVGMMRALGVHFLDDQHQPIKHGGAALADIQTIDTSQLDSRVQQVDITVACDVRNPLLGKDGATYTYGRQKGADDTLLSQLEVALAHYHSQISTHLSQDVKNIPGAGAAGGLGTALLAFLHAELTPGIEVVLQETNFEHHVKDADLVITGEGQMDYQSIYGKTPIGVAQVAQRHDVPVIAINGVLGDGYQAVYEHGIAAAFSILQRNVSLDTALKNGPLNLEYTSENVARILNLSYNSNN